MSTESIPLELTMEIPIFNLKGSTFIIMKRQVTALASNVARKIFDFFENLLPKFRPY